MEGTTTAEVRIPGHGGEEIGGFLARPAGAGPWPAVVLVHEVFGLSDHVRDLAGRLAEDDFVALAPDLWWREREGGLPAPDADLAEWRAFVEGIPDARMIGDLVASALALRTRPEVRRDAIGTVGFCMGGIYAFHLACEEGTPVRACVDFYGRLRYDAPTPHKPRGNLDRVAELRCPFLGIFGALDPLIPLEDVLRLKESVGGRGSVIAYPRAGHAFLNDTRPSFRPDEAEDAWERCLLFLRERLAPDTLPDDAPPAVPEFREPKGKGSRRGGRRRRRK